MHTVLFCCGCIINSLWTHIANALEILQSCTEPWYVAAVLSCIVCLLTPCFLLCNPSDLTLLCNDSNYRLIMKAALSFSAAFKLFPSLPVTPQVPNPIMYLARSIGSFIEGGRKYWCHFAKYIFRLMFENEICVYLLIYWLYTHLWTSYHRNQWGLLLIYLIWYQNTN